MMKTTRLVLVISLTVFIGAGMYIPEAEAKRKDVCVKKQFHA